jgi:hypothetical protein
MAEESYVQKIRLPVCAIELWKFAWGYKGLSICGDGWIGLKMHFFREQTWTYF